MYHVISAVSGQLQHVQPHRAETVCWDLAESHLEISVVSLLFKIIELDVIAGKSFTCIN